MQSFFLRIFDTSDYPARWTCGNWSAFEGWLHIVSDSLIFLAYAAIPMILFVYLRSRRDVAFPAVAWLFIAFILACGVTHAVEASIFWWPAYRFSGVLKAITALVSVATAIALIRVLPPALSLPSVKRINADLEDALRREKSLHAELVKAHSVLENRTSELAVRDRKLRDAVGAAKACALAWNPETGEILWSLGFAEAMASAGIKWPDTTPTRWSEIIGEEGQAALIADSLAAVADNEVIHRHFGLAGHDDRWDVRMTATPDRKVKGEPTTISGMLGLVPKGDAD